MASCIDCVDVGVLQSRYDECIQILDTILEIALRGEAEDINRVRDEVTKACAELYAMRDEYQKANSLRNEHTREWETAVKNAEEVLNHLKTSGEQRQTANDELTASHDTLSGKIRDQEELIASNQQALKRQEDDSDRLEQIVRRLSNEKEGLSNEVEGMREQREQLESLKSTMQDREKQLGERELLLERSKRELAEKIRAEQQQDENRALELLELKRKRTSIDVDQTLIKRSRLDLLGLVGLSSIPDNGQETLEKAADSYQRLTTAVKGRINNLEAARKRVEDLNRTLLKDKELLTDENNILRFTATSDTDIIGDMKVAQAGLETDNKQLREVRDVAESRIKENQNLLDMNREILSSLDTSADNWRALAKKYREPRNTG